MRLAVAVLGVVLLASPAVAQPIRQRAASTQPGAAVQQQASAPSSGFTRVVLALGAVVSLIFVIKWGAGRYMIGGGASSGQSRAVQILTRTIVAPRQQLMLVKVGRRLVLVSNTGAGMNPICEIRDEQEVAELLGQVQADRGDSVTKAFGSLFRREEAKFSPDAAANDEMAGDGSRPARSDEGEPPESAAVGATRDELSGLMEKVRLVSKQFRRS